MNKQVIKKIKRSKGHLLHKYHNVVDLDTGHGAEGTGKDTKKKTFTWLQCNIHHFLFM